MRHFDAADSIERDPKARSAILSNQSRLLAILGEYSSAVSRQHEANLLLEGTDAKPDIRAIALDVEAQHLERLGDLKQAIDLSERAAGLFPETAVEGRATNALIRAELGVTRLVRNRRRPRLTVRRLPWSNRWRGNQSTKICIGGGFSPPCHTGCR